MIFYLDTSALVPAYVPERRSGLIAERLAGAESIYLSQLAEVEFLSALALKVRSRQMDRKDAERAAKVFARHMTLGLFIRLEITAEVFDQAAAEIGSLVSSLRTLDALHLACCAHYRLPLVTADKEMAQSARRMGIRCELV